jgi:hypothetical protein
VLEEMLRVIAEVGPGAAWIMVFCAAMIAVFVLYIGIALFATLRAGDEEQRKIRFELFRELLRLFRRERHR